MKKSIKINLLISLLLLSSSVAVAESTKKVAIIVPAEIQALEEITQSFETSLQKQYPGKIEFKVANTQGDLNLQYATIKSLRDQPYDIIAPIGTDATSMTLSLIKETPVLSLASDLSETDRKKLHPCNVAIVHDEITAQEQMNFIHATYPDIKKIVLMHSAADKIFPEVEATKTAAKKIGIDIIPMMATTLPDLQIVANNIPQDAQAIFILKDMQMVSGIAQLANIAKKHHMVLISSDDGSVKNGAGFALGVHENQIGINGAALAAEILRGKNACDLPITEMKNLTVFLNPKAMKSFGVSTEAIKTGAEKMKYQIEIM